MFDQTHLISLAANVVTIVALACGVYYRRHGRRDMIVPYIGINIGVFAVTSALLDSGVSMGLGLGLFGVLSIIRLRSSEISHEDVAYYFASLAIGLICGLNLTPAWVGPALAGLVVAVMAIADHPALHRAHRRQRVTLDAAYHNEAEVIAHLERLLGADVRRAQIVATDLVRDSTVVDVSYRARTTSRVDRDIIGGQLS